MFVNIVEFLQIKKGKDEGSPTPGFYDVLIITEKKR